ncbi:MULTISPECIES: GpE family phage tail protein [Chromobacterium]|uniref:GpE family phage tail protein n=1 Tax=Chromobacterium subtsugae TaxID=251747 RepID=UPI00096DB7BC
MTTAELWAGAALLAKWFHFQPSEIDGLEVADFLAWCERATEQIRIEQEAYG